MEALPSMSTRIRFRRDTAANWTSADPTLTTGELGYETNTGKFKIGDNTTAWTSLAYSITAELGEGNLNDLKDVTITSAANGDFLRWNGTAWINDAVNLATDTVGSYVASLTAGTGITLSNNSGEEASPTVAVDTTVIQERVTNVTDTEIGYLDGVTSAIQSQLDTKAPTASPTFTGTVSGVTATMVGLGSVDNTADTAKPVSTAQQTALDLKANLASPTFTGTVTVPDDSFALGTKTTGDYVQSLVAGTGVTLTNGAASEGGTPTVAIDTSVVATKTYVDATSAGLNWHDAVNQATTAVLPYTPTYSNGTSGVGATLTGTSNARLQIDGINTITGRRVLVKTQADAKQNGIYLVTEQGSVSVAYILTRVSDFDSSAGIGIISSGEAVYVVNGASNSGQGFVVSSFGTGTNDAHVVNTDTITFTQFTGTSAFIAGDGLSSTGNTVSITTESSGRIVVNADSIDLASGVSSTGTFKSVTVDTYGRVTDGTNPTTLAGYGITDAAPSASPTFTGTVSGISASMVGLNNVDNTSDANKPVSTAGQTALDLKADLASPTFTGTVSGISATMVGLGNVDDTSNATERAAAVTLTNKTLTSPVVNTPTGIVKGDVGLGSVDNTADTAKPVSTAQQTALDLKANLASPTFTGTVTIPSGASISGFAPLASPELTGTPTAPTASANTDTTQVATTAFVTNAVSTGISGVSIDALDDVSDVTITTAADGDLLKWNGTAWVNASGYALLASPALTGTPTATTASAGDNSTQIATTAYADTAVANLVASAPAALNTLDELAAALGDDENFATTITTSIGLKAPLASPTFTGTPTLPTGTIATTQTAANSTTAVATTAFVTTANNLKANLASPTFTGTVTLPSGTVTSAMILDGTIADADISTTAAIDLGKLADVSTSAQTASYTLVLADKNKIVEMSVATANTLTVPPNSSVAYPVGSQINILQTGAGQTTVTAGAGVTVNATPGLKIRTQWSYATLVKRATDTWVLVGDISA
jgi:trimeric autotransporter adhesin